MLITFESWTDDSLAPAHARDVAAAIWSRRPGGIYSAQIEDELGISGALVRTCVHYLRESGAPIASEGGIGYLWATRPEQLDKSIQHGYQRAASNHAWAEALQRIRDEMATRRDMRRADNDVHATTLSLEQQPGGFVLAFTDDIPSPSLS